MRAADGDIVLFDILTDAHLTTIGEVLNELQRRENKPLFVVGSSSIESALTLACMKKQSLDSGGKSARTFAAVDSIIAVSGSCSPVTGRQIDWAVAHGFVGIHLDVASISSHGETEAALAAIATRTAREHEAGRSVVIYTCRGAADSQVAARAREGAAGMSPGAMLGQVLRQVLQARPVRRIAVAGGDTAGDVARSLGIDELHMVAPLVPGAPLCQARSRRPEIDGVEVTFKGGQVGQDDFFGVVRSPKV
jgi:uncharacterized protein YgbK (DUF1537 family)